MSELENVEVRNAGVFTIDNKDQGKSDVNAVPFEDALDMTGFGRYNWSLYVISNVMLLAMAIETFGTSYVVTASACDLGLTTETKGLVAAMPMLGIVVSSHLWGWVADTRGRRVVLIVSMGGTCLSAIIASFSTGWVMLAFFKFIAAFFASASNSVTYALLGECTPRAHRNKLVMLTSSGLMFAQGAMTFTAYPILRLKLDVAMLGAMRYRPWRLLEQVFGLWSAVALGLLLCFVKESPKFHASRGDQRASVTVLREIYHVNRGKHAPEYTVKSITFDELISTSKAGVSVVRSMWDQTTPLFRRPLLRDTCVILYIVIIVYSIGPAFLMWMPSTTNAFARATAAGARDVNFCQLLQYTAPSSPAAPAAAAAAAAPIDYNTTVATGGGAGGAVGAGAPCVDTIEDFTFVTLLCFSAAMAITNAINSCLIKYVGKRTIVVILHLISGLSGLCLPWIYNTNASLIVFFLFQSNIVAMGLTTGFTVEVYPTYLRAMAVCLTMMVGRGVSFLFISYVGVLMETRCDTAFYVFGALVLSGAFVALLLPSEVNRDKPTKSDST